jgi:hypothetical protein
VCTSHVPALRSAPINTWGVRPRAVRLSASLPLALVRTARVFDQHRLSPLPMRNLGRATPPCVLPCHCTATAPLSAAPFLTVSSHTSPSSAPAPSPRIRRFAARVPLPIAGTRWC